MSFRKQRMFSIISLKAQVCASASTDYEKLMPETEEYCDRDWVTEQICNENNE